MFRKSAVTVMAVLVLVSFSACGKAQTDFSGMSTRESRETQDPFTGYKTICVYKNGDLAITRDFDTVGNMTIEKYLGDDGYDIKYEYDAQNNLIKDERFGLDGASQGGCEYEYDAQGDLTAKKYFDADGKTTMSFAYEYDKDHNMSKSTEFNGEGNTVQWIEYTYDPLGNLLNQKQSDPQGGSYEIKNTYEYSKYGDVTKSVNYRAGKVNGKAEFEYDGSGNVTVEKRFKADGSFKSHSTYEYDDLGYLIKMVTLTKDGKVFQSVEYERDNVGNILIQTTYGSDGEIAEMYQYAYN